MNNRTARRATAATAAILASIAMSSPAWSAAAGPDLFAGTAEALALEVRVTGPAELFGPLTDDGSNTIVQRISFTDARLESDGPASLTTSLLDGLIDQTSTATAEPGTGGDQLLGQSVGPLTVEAGTTSWTLDPFTGLSRSFSELAEARVSLAPLLAELPAEVSAGLQEAVDQATETVNQLVGELNGALDQVEDAVNQVREQAPVDIPSVLPEELPGVPDITSVDLLHVRKMWSESQVETVGDVVRSTAHGGVTELSLLGGLVTVPTFQFTSVAETAGTPGTAAASTDTTTLAVTVGDQLVEIDGTALTVGDVTIDLADPELEGVPAGDLLGEVEGILGELLNAGGLAVTQSEGVTDVADDGSAASASTSAFALRLRPLNASADEDVIDVEVLALPTRAAASGAVTAAAPPAAPNMPRTGGGALTMLFGALAMASAARVWGRAG